MPTPALSEFFPEGPAGRSEPSGSHFPLGARRTGLAGPSLRGPCLAFASDAAAILLSALFSGVLCFAFEGRLTHFVVHGLRSASTAALLAVPGFMVAFFALAWSCGVYHATPIPRTTREIAVVLQAAVTAGVLLFVVLQFTPHGHTALPTELLFVGTAVLLMCLSRVVLPRFQAWRSIAGIHPHNILIVGTGHVSKALGDHIAVRPALQCKVAGYLSTAPPADARVVVAPEQVLAHIQWLRQAVRSQFVDELVVAEECTESQLAFLLKEAHALGITVRTVTCFHPEVDSQQRIEYLGIYPVRALYTPQIRALEVVMKRVIDIVFAAMMLLAVAPVMLVVAIAIVLETRGPVFYVAQRVGKRGRAFPCFKFRSMVVNADALKAQIASRNERDGILFKITGDPRVTRVGAIIRKYSLDELPQLFNVLRGEMSLVGPRPPIASEVEKYKLEHFRRLEVLPGLTGLWQVQARGDASFARYIELDTAYVERWSLWLDFKIMLRTASVILRGTGC